VSTEPLPAPEKAEIVARVEAARAVLLEALNHYDEIQLTAARDENGWNVADHITHMMAWQRSVVCLLSRRPRHEGLGVDESTYLRGDRSLPEALAAFDDVHNEMIAVLDGLTTADLQLPYSDYLPDEPGDDTGAPVWGWIAGNTIFHYEDHLRWIEAMIATAEGSSSRT
jgi:hypothetical protein